MFFNPLTQGRSCGLAVVGDLDTQQDIVPAQKVNIATRCIALPIF